MNSLEQKRMELLSEYSLLADDGAISTELNKRFESFFQELVIQMLSGDNLFFANFIINFKRELNFNIIEPLTTRPVGSYFILYINPVLVLECCILEIQGLVKHEVYHILCLHHIRAQKLIKQFSSLAVNLAMDVSINQYILELPNWAQTLESVANSYNVYLPKDETLENYVYIIQEALSKKNKKIGKNNIEEKQSNSNRWDEGRVPIESFHKMWIGSAIDFDENNLLDSVNTIIEESSKIEKPASVDNLLSKIKESSQISWKNFLKKSLGMIPDVNRKTIMRMDRRQPDRLDLRGKLREHIRQIIVAIDTSGSMTEREIESALVEIANIARIYNSKLIVLECDDDIQKIYSLNSLNKELRKPSASGGTKFTPVFKYIKNNRLSEAILIYFTDGQGEKTIDNDIIHNKTIWVLTSSDQKLSINNPAGTVFVLRNTKEQKDNLLPLEYLKSEMKEIRSEWAK